MVNVKNKITAVLLAALMLLFCSCGKGGLPAADSPAPMSYTVSASSKGTENTQKVLIKVLFDKAIAVGKNAEKDFRILISEKPMDKKTMDFKVLQDPDDGKTLDIEIFALSKVTSPDKGGFFALYDGDMSITAANKNGISGITDRDRKTSVKWKDIKCVVPSGLTIKTCSAVTGNAASGTRAKVVAEVTNVASVRVVTWIQLLRNNSPAMEAGYSSAGYKYQNEGSVPIHAHQFLLYSQKDYAGQIVSSLKKFFGKAGEYTFSQDGNKFAVEAVRPVDGEKLEVKVYASDGVSF